MKAKFDEMAFNIISCLDNYDEVVSIELEATNSKAEIEILAWEKANYPYRIPKDMRDFYMLWNGDLNMCRDHTNPDLDSYLY